MNTLPSPSRLTGIVSDDPAFDDRLAAVVASARWMARELDAMFFVRMSYRGRLTVCSRRPRWTAHVEVARGGGRAVFRPARRPAGSTPGPS